jgi:hypothetical protein
VFVRCDVTNPIFGHYSPHRSADGAAARPVSDKLIQNSEKPSGEGLGIGKALAIGSGAALLFRVERL